MERREVVGLPKKNPRELGRFYDRNHPHPNPLPAYRERERAGLLLPVPVAKDFEMVQSAVDGFQRFALLAAPIVARAFDFISCRAKGDIRLVDAMPAMLLG